MNIYTEHHYNSYIEIDLWLDSTGCIKYPIRYDKFDIVGESVYELYSEIASWGSSSYVNNYQMVVI